MNIGIIGATGKAGHFLTKEARQRHHQVTAIVRSQSKLQHDGVSVLAKDLFDLTEADLAPFDVVIDAFGSPPGQEQLHQSSLLHLIKLFKHLPQVRLLVVGGAASLYTDASKHTRLLDTPDFPEAYKATASNMAKAFEVLKHSDINWTYLSPSAFFDPDGPATGQYQLGDDVLLLNAEKQSYVSYADYAKAMLDEAESKTHVRKRFTVASNPG